ncbi:hypothetical protein SK45_02356 [Enterobacter hormaechei]|nr:hypothetical protein SK45_02356 [Enterobacter hormaechei]KLW13005.1 hypothetical protein SK46_01408 [Enterobacter hormaechei]
MKIYRPLWEDGAFLAPQQFQQQARWDAHVADTVARMALAHPWGVLCAEFDEGALALSRLNATRLCVRFADGTLVDTDLADNLPPVCDLSAVGSDALKCCCVCHSSAPTAVIWMTGRTVPVRAAGSLNG